MAALVEEALPTSKLNGLKLDDEEPSPISENVRIENGFNQKIENEKSPSVSSDEPSSPTSGKGINDLHYSQICSSTLILDGDLKEPKDKK